MSALVSRRALAALPLVALWPAARAAPRREARWLFGSPTELLWAGATSTAVVQAVWQGLQQMNDRWNAWKPGELTELNLALRQGRSATVTPGLRALIEGAAPLEAASAGHFNPAIGGLVGAWGFHSDHLGPGHRPDPALLRAWLRARPSLSQLSLRGHRVSGSHRALQLDFGGYAKGVALDWALDQVAAQGAGGALLNLGGNLASVGTADGRAWEVGIRDPDRDGVLACLSTGLRESVVTSGSYERYRWLDGERVTHIIDPSGGRPAPDLVSVTVVHRSASLADAAATALLVAGTTRWRGVAARMGVDQVMTIDRQRRVSVTPRLAPRLRFVADDWTAA